MMIVKTLRGHEMTGCADNRNKFQKGHFNPDRLSSVNGLVSERVSWYIVIYRNEEGKRKRERMIQRNDM